MAEFPQIGVRRLGSDPAKKKYGTIVYGLKVFVDGLSEASGFSSAQVVAAMTMTGLLGAAVVIGAAVVLMRDGSPAAARPSFEAARTAPEPDAASRPASPAPLSPFAQAAPSPSSYHTTSLPIEPLPAAPPPVARQTTPEPAPARRPAAPARAPMAANRNPVESWAQMSDFKSRTVTSTAQRDLPQDVPSGEGRFTSRFKAESGGYGDDIPEVGDIAGGVLGTDQGPLKKKLAAKTGEAPKGKDGKSEGPVPHAEMPDTGPGVQLNNVPAAGGPAGVARIEKAGDPLSTPIDVNRITLDPSKAHNVDQSGGVIGIGR
ncbi:MAG: hypothetical protein HYZ75_08915 [Elusimicrobia bacterium]|nr:hypothetical protein [Elusimicrobiota bacterium]